MSVQQTGRSSAVRLGVAYAAGLTSALLLTTAEVLAVVWSLSGQAFGEGSVLATRSNLVLLVAVVVAGTSAAALGGYATIRPALRWFAADRVPDLRQRRNAINVVRHQSVLLLTIWAVGGSAMILANLDAGGGPLALIAYAVAFGSASTVSTSLLFSQRVYRPIVAAASTAGVPAGDTATEALTGRTTAPGIASRLVMMWLINSALPSLAIMAMIVCKVNGWFIPTTVSLDVPVIVLSAVAVLLGLRALILVARSISDPVRDVVDAMAEVERGDIGRVVVVYEQSEIGRLQRGFNSMVAGLIERDRLRDLFGRHVGPDVARRAVEVDDTLSGEVRDVAILFIDLAGSTQLTVSRTPREVADVLNEFFSIVVAAVDEHDGLINKFQGDAALAVFGAPVRTDSAPAAALATARTLSANLRRLPVVDFGIGVSAGPVFAGNIGAANRYEYTVIGDPVNEAARLADVAKTSPGRTMASGAVISRTDDAERRHWTTDAPVVLRGRAEATEVSIPRGRGPQ